MSSGGLNYPISSYENWFMGEDRTLQWTVSDLNGAAVNITGWTIQWKLEATEGSTALLTKTASITDGPNGICQVAIAAADTSALTPGNLWYVLARIDSGNNDVLAYGAALLRSR